MSIGEFSLGVESWGFGGLGGSGEWGGGSGEWGVGGDV